MNRLALFSSVATIVHDKRLENSPATTRMTSLPMSSPRVLRAGIVETSRSSVIAHVNQLRGANDLNVASHFRMQGETE